MPAGVTCRQCGTVNPADARVCSKCRAALGNADKTDKRPSLASLQKAGGKVKDSESTAPDDTMAEDPPPPTSRPKATGPRPAAPVTPRKASPAAPQRPPVSQTTTGGARDSLIGQKLQEYVIKERIGVGGMGNVYRAVQPMIGKEVAIKVLRADIVTDPRDMDRLLDEARVVNSIKHRGIINIFGAGTLPDGRHYLIMELLEGESLEALMQRDGTVPAADAVVILDEVLSALAAAHSAGIVHRDLKPANVFLVNESAKFYVKLLDFGLARRQQQQNVTRIAGTPDYISPEHARGRPAGPPADLYAFGVLCFHMLTGRLPFIGNTPMEVMEQHVHSAPPIPHELNPQIPKALSELILKLLGKEPGERPDAQQVKADLRAATKQLRNAATMMSLAQIDAVPARPGDAKQEEQRARSLAVAAQVADVKRQLTRRWPYVAGAVVGVWLLGVAVYFAWPAPDPTVVRPPRHVEQPDANPLVVPDKTPVVVPDKTPVAVVTADAGPIAEVLPPVTPDAGEAVAVAPAEEDAGEEPVEDKTVPLDDFRLFAEKVTKRNFEGRISNMRAIMEIKEKHKLKLLYEHALDAVQAQCEAARTMNQVLLADDELKDLEGLVYAR